MTVGEYINNLLDIIDSLENYDDDEILTLSEDESGIKFIVGEIEAYNESLNWGVKCL